LTRYELTESGALITGHTMAGLGGTGQINATGASDLRGVGVDDLGRIWMADKSGGKVFRIDNDGTDLFSVVLDNAIDIDFDGERAFVTQYTTRTISVFDEDMPLVDVVGVPWTGLELDPDGQSGGGALSGIVVLDGLGFYVSNETGQTANEKSIYGRIDGNSGIWEIGDGGDGRYYKDLHYDGNDPIPFATPEPNSYSVTIAWSWFYTPKTQVKAFFALLTSKKEFFRENHRLGDGISEKY
jgi:hypothetical protein